MRDIFFNERRLRAGWRLLAFLALLFLFMVLAAAPLAPFLPDLEGEGPQAMRLSLLLDGYLLLPLFLVSWLLTRFVDRRPFASIGLNLKGPWLKELLLGAAIGLAMGGAYLIVGLLVGSVTIGWNGGGGRELALIAGGLLLAALFEELLFHGYPFQTLIEGIGPYPALLLLSVVFSLFHRANPGFNLLGSINIGLAGLLLGVGLLRTRALWLPIGIHFAWNLFQAAFSFPISGFALGDGPFHAQLGGPELLSGGSFGPEGSIIATLVFFLAIAFLVLYGRIRPSKRMEELWREHIRPLSSKGLEI